MGLTYEFFWHINLGTKHWLDQRCVEHPALHSVTKTQYKDGKPAVRETIYYIVDGSRTTNDYATAAEALAALGTEVER